MLATLFTRLGWSRDDAKWTIGIFIAIVVGLATLSEDMVKTIGLPPAILPWLPWCRLVSFLVGIVSAKMATSNLFGKGNVPSDSGSVGPRLPIVVLAAVLGGMLMASCASTKKLLPRLPDGRVDVETLLNWAEAGVDADCMFGSGAAAADVCTFGTDAIADARALYRKDPAAGVAGVKQSLADSAKRWPPIDPYVRWLIDGL